jgi:hypothetical protein
MDEQAIVKLLPGVQDSDANSVKMSLEAARALAMSGEPEEALRLVRRAVEGAEQAGDDMRSINLARAAADIANEIERLKKGADASDASAPDVAGRKKNLPSPPSRPPKSVPTPPPMPSSSAPAVQVAPAPPSTRASHVPPAPSAKSSPHAAAPPSPAHETEPHAPVEAEGRALSAESVVTHESPKLAHEPAAHAPALHADPPGHAERPQAVAPKKAEVRSSPVAVASATVPAEGINELVSQGRAVRVLVKRSARDETLYIVRPLGSGHPPHGAREAFLVLGDADAEFLSGVGG